MTKARARKVRAFFFARSLASPWAGSRRYPGREAVQGIASAHACEPDFVAVARATFRRCLQVGMRAGGLG